MRPLYGDRIPIGGETLESRVQRLERCLGTLLILLADSNIIGPEDISFRELAYPPTDAKDRNKEQLQPEVPF